MAKKSLVEIAQKAGFTNIHYTTVRWCVLKPNFIFSDKFEIIYYKSETENEVLKKYSEKINFKLPPLGTLNIFGIKEPFNYEKCALYKFEIKDIINYRQEEEINLDKFLPFCKGKEAVNILLENIKEYKLSKTKHN